MKGHSFYFCILTILNYWLTTCTNISISTNFTLSRLREMEKSIDQCEDDEDCPFGCKCLSSGCIFGNILCLENENIPCVLINDTIYSYNNEIYNYPYKNNLKNEEKKPILKTCDKINVDNKSCSTEKCKENNDCFSGLCYSNNCVTGNSTVYLCTGYHYNKKMKVKCGKQSQMKCTINEECNSDKCEEGFCKNYLSDAAVDWDGMFNTFLKYLFIGIILIILLIIIVVHFYKKKHTK